jgi:hypothetical protein
VFGRGPALLRRARVRPRNRRVAVDQMGYRLEPFLNSPVSRVLVTTTETAYCVGNATFSSGTATANGFIRATRVN